MAVYKISEFTTGIPTPTDKILFEQGGEGKSATFSDLPVSTAARSEFNLLKGNIADIANRMDDIGLSVVDGKLCITYLKEI